jgi:hypothetical protein
VTDKSAGGLQTGTGTLVITLVDINDFSPVFPEPWSLENPFISISVPEEMQNGTVVHRFIASDADSNIDSYKIQPRNR